MCIYFMCNFYVQRENCYIYLIGIQRLCNYIKIYIMIQMLILLFHSLDPATEISDFYLFFLDTVRYSERLES